MTKTPTRLKKLTRTNVIRKLGASPRTTPVNKSPKTTPVRKNKSPKTTPVRKNMTPPPNSNNIRNGLEIVFRKNDSKLFTQKKNEILRSLNPPISACRGEIALPWAREMARTASAYILAYDVLNSGIRGKLRGFVLIDLVYFKEKNNTKFMKDWLYIDLICRAKGPTNGRAASGKDMIDAAKRLTRKLGKRGILLSALEPVIPFYQKLGFSIAHKQIMQGKDPCTGRPNRKWRNSVTREHLVKDGIKMTLCL
jgi:hypothetical protein